MTRKPSRVFVAALTAAALLPAPSAAQGWAADLYAGGTRAHGVAAQVTSTSLMGNLRYQWLSGPLAYLSLGAPLGEGALWGAAGMGGRSQRPLDGRFTYGSEAALDAFAYRGHAADTTGSGGSFRLNPFLSLDLPTAAVASVELRGGLHLRQFGGSRRLLEVGGRATVAPAALALVGDARWLRGDTATYPFVGAQAVRTFARGRAWASAGRWLGGLDQSAWEAGASWSVGGSGELWASVRQDATDPLYDNPARRSWNVGFSRALGRRPEALPGPVVARGRARLTLSEKAVPGAGSAAVRVAGEFNRWMPAPMTRAGDRWVLELPLASGVYRFAFVSAAGEWFVPDGYPGRVDDDMGGHVAVLVIP